MILGIQRINYSHTVGLRQATQASIFGQEAVLQVDQRLSDLLVFGQHVVVVQHHPQVLVQREGAGELEHPGEETTEEEQAELGALEASWWRPTPSSDHDLDIRLSGNQTDL